MYSHRQAAWRSAWVVGAILSPLVLVQMYQGLDRSIASPLLPIPVTALVVGVLMLVLAAAFGLGFRLARIDAVGLKVIAITAAVYLVPLVALATLPIKTHAVLVDLPTTRLQSLQAFALNVLFPVGGVVFVLFAYPSAVAFGVAKVVRGGARVA